MEVIAARFVVSIHAPARGATPRPMPQKNADRKFQSTRPRGARRTNHRAAPQPTAVSIHAPARGATTRTNPDNERADVSIHAPARGATRGRKNRNTHCRFQSTRPRGARHRATLGHAQKEQFQSTRPRGARHLGVAQRRKKLLVSIHAPARGATYFKCCAGSKR